VFQRLRADHGPAWLEHAIRLGNGLLLPGDVLATGTPAGIGSARTPPVYLQSGDRIECAVDGLGRQNNPAVKILP